MAGRFRLGGGWEQVAGSELVGWEQMAGSWLGCWLGVGLKTINENVARVRARAIGRARVTVRTRMRARASS